MHTLRHVIGRHQPATAPSNTTVMQAAAVMAGARVGAICIVDGLQLVGVFSERDLMTRVLVAGRDPGSTPVAEVMSTDVVSASIDETRSDCLDKMQRHGCRHLPVLEGDRLVAMISMRDLLRDEIQEQRQEIDGLQAYLHSHPV